MAGVGQTGYWRTGVWVEPLDAFGEFSLAATGVLDQWSGRFTYGGSFNLVGAAVVLFDGVNTFRGEFTMEADGVLDFEGTFVPIPFTAAFGMVGSGRLVVAWVPDLGPPGGQVDPDPTAGSVECIVGPGDVYVVDGVAGTVTQDSTGRLTVVDQNGEVMCILGPGGVEQP